MSRRSGSPIRDMNLPTIADLRGAVEEARRYADAAKTEHDLAIRIVTFLTIVAVLQVLMVIWIVAR